VKQRRGCSGGETGELWEEKLHHDIISSSSNEKELSRNIFSFP